MKTIFSPLSFPLTESLIADSISNCSKKCDIYLNFTVFDNTFKCTATGKYYKVKGILSCNIVNVVYMITCQGCMLQYAGSYLSKKDFTDMKVI